MLWDLNDILRAYPLPDAQLPADATPAQRIWDTVRHVETHPNEWDQGSWGRVSRCGTTRCMAGWVVYRAGYRAIPAPWDAESRYLDYVLHEELPLDIAAAASEEYAVKYTGVHPVVEVEWLANRLLRIDDETGGALWYCNAMVIHYRVTELFGLDPVVP